VERLEALIAAHRRMLQGEREAHVEVDLRAVVDDALQVLLPRIRQQGVEVRKTLPEAPVPVRASPGQLSQILLNLLVNALDAVQAASARRLQVVLRAEGPELLVADDGAGLAPDAVARLFTPFFTTKASGSGTGLGLFVSRTLAEANGATLTWVPASSSGLDARTVFRLAFAPVAAKPAKARRSVLVVDDEEIIRALLGDLLAKEDLELHTAATGDEALRLLETRTFDLVLTDKNLPGASGLDIARAVRRRSASCPVMLMTGYPSVETAQEGLAIGLVDYLEKPFTDIDLVRRRIRETLQGPREPARPPQRSRKVVVVEDRGQDALQIAEAVAMAGGVAVVVSTLAEAMAARRDGAAGVILSLDLRDRALTPAAMRELKGGSGALVTLCDHPTLEQTVAAIRMGAAVCLPRALASPQALARELQRLLSLGG
ncbi:MAG: response regulator, partial [Myxococcales bacterium]